MRRLLGYTLFCIGVGMTIMMLIPNEFVGFLIICACLIAGYNLFCC